MTSLLERVKDAMGDAQTAAALALLRTAQQQLVYEPDADPLEDALALLRAGEPVSADLGDRLVAQQRHFDAFDAHRQALTRLAERLQFERSEQLAGGADRALGVLRDELEGILDASSATLSRIAGVDSAQAAIDAHAVDEWRTALDLAGRYREVRQLQAVVVSAARNRRELPASSTVAAMPRASRQVRELVMTIGTVSDFARRYPRGFIPQEAEPTGTGITHIKNLDQATRPTEMPWATEDPVVNLRWIHTHRDVVWLPSLAQLTGAEQHAADRVQDLLDEEQARRTADARERAWT